MIESLINKAKDELINRPIVAIDYLLDAISKAKQEEIANLLILFFNAILKSREIDEKLLEEDPIESIFNKKIAFQDKCFIGICLLRLLSTNTKCFEERNFNNKTFDLFDIIFLENLYPRLKLKEKDLKYKKRNKLIDIIPNIEKELDDVILSLRNLNMLSNFRHKFMDKINNLFSKIIIHLFFQKNFLGWN